MTAPTTEQTVQDATDRREATGPHSPRPPRGGVRTCRPAIVRTGAPRDPSADPDGNIVRGED
ncbi:hypothetical protein KUM39_22860 [Streptomyces sp. J2-1]|uniref:hypothetical protein n=1 Tax=Streptomyces corallincola TaxID=2851888 RepID=UPI001C393ED7|nr:hypothetical protein [Streptomyces corallincola]MBV2357180.1 hypothetical protein [Streptomyces corallincola]